MRREQARRIIGQVSDENIDEFVEFVCNKGVDGFVDEFYDGIRFVDDCGVEAFKRNKARNRHQSVRCLDGTRVKLLDEANDYIHANYISTYLQNHAFIVTQAPMENTCAHFWKMVYQERCEVITMLCSFIEDGHRKSAQYVPMTTDQTLTVDGFTISVIGTLQSKCDFYWTTSLTLTLGEDTRHVEHYLVSSWPDRKLPKQPKILASLLENVRNRRTPIIHCSTGVGRAGTLVAIQWVLDAIRTGSHWSEVNVLSEMRKQRAHAISTDVQYVFVFEYVMVLLESGARLGHHLKTLAQRFHADFARLDCKNATFK